MASQNGVNKKDKSNQPHFLRPKVDGIFLLNNPRYKSLFHACPSCDNNSLKPVGYKNMTPVYIQNNEKTLERKCSLCGYILKPRGLENMK